jgi:hypothetical protein
MIDEHPKFRKGDVVRHQCGEGRVLDVTALVWASIEGEIAGFRGDDLTLLRRPIQDGDTIIDTTGVCQPFHVSNVAGRFHDVACLDAYDGGLLWWVDIEKRWTHADGTPIDPPPMRNAFDPATDKSGNTFSHPPIVISARAGAVETKFTDCTIGNLPTQEEYARALFESDPEVVKFVEFVGDAWREDAGIFSGRGNPRTERALSIAWERNENGWRTRAEDRAVALIDALNVRRRSANPKDRP